MILGISLEELLNPSIITNNIINQINAYEHSLQHLKLNINTIKYIYTYTQLPKIIYKLTENPSITTYHINQIEYNIQKSTGQPNTPQPQTNQRTETPPKHS